MLKFGDASILGLGPGGVPTLIGIEIKRVSDLLSCIWDERYAGYQLPGMLDHYDVVKLLILGEFRPAANGRLEVPYKWGHWGPPKKDGRPIMYSMVDNWCTTMMEKGGVHEVKRAKDDVEAAAILTNWHGWWAEGYDEHTSHQAIYTGAGRSGPGVVSLSPSRFRHRVAKTLPGVGFTRSNAVAACLPTFLEMAEAGQEDWRKVPGIGETGARRIWEAIRDPDAE